MTGEVLTRDRRASHWMGRPRRLSCGFSAVCWCAEYSDASNLFGEHLLNLPMYAPDVSSGQVHGSEKVLTECTPSFLSATRKDTPRYLGSSRPCSTPQAISLTALVISWRDVYAKQTLRKHLRMAEQNDSPTKVRVWWSEWWRSSRSLAGRRHWEFAAHVKGGTGGCFMISKSSWNKHVLPLIRSKLNDLWLPSWLYWHWTTPLWY